jgi:methyl-accepting chemotaxis protein
VKDLAQQTALAAEEIISKIDAIKHTTNDASNSITSISGRIRETNNAIIQMQQSSSELK